ncbi:MAG: chlorosome protein E [Chlorobiaceae bacterium]|nr:chlorosome protein E [Chlorobiaceae bacterium]NTW73484.1 chlorosome protein E [Chlorobiaceae bacterium]
MNSTPGVFVQGAESYGRLLEVFIDGHWWVVGDYLENVGKCTKRLGANAYPSLYSGNATIGALRGSSPGISGYAIPSKEIQSRFSDQ